MRPVTSKPHSQQKNGTDGSTTTFRITDVNERFIKRSIPTNMLYDKEKLYLENNKLKQELLSLKFDLKKERQEQANFERIVTKQNETNKDVSLIIQMRARIKEQNQLLKEQEEQLMKQKKQPLRTQTQELQRELEVLRSEYKSLQNKLCSKLQQESVEAAVANISLKDELASNLLAAYKEDNINLATQVAELQADNAGLINHNRQIKMERDKANMRIKEYERQIDNLNKHMQYLRNEVQNSKKQTQQEDLLKKIDELQYTHSQTGIVIANQNKQIEESEAKLSELQHSFEVYKSMEIKEKEKLQDRIAMLKKQIEDMQQQQDESDDHDDSIDSFKNMQHQQSLAVIVHKKTLGKVNTYEIVPTITKLKLKLLSNKVDFKLQESILVYGSESTVSLEDITLRLQGAPFELLPDDALLVARYLVEDNNEEYIEYNPQRLQDKPILQSVYRKLIGEYHLFSEEERQDIHMGFEQLFSKYGGAMESAIKQCTISKKHLGANICELVDFDEALKYCDIQLNSRWRLYLDLIIFQESPEMQKINYLQLLQKFQNQTNNEQ